MNSFLLFKWFISGFKTFPVALYERKWRWTFWTLFWGSYSRNHWIHNLVMGDSRLKERDFVSVVGISSERLHNNSYLNKKNCSQIGAAMTHRWLETRPWTCSKAFFQLFPWTPYEFSRRSSLGTWIHAYTFETSQGVASGKSLPKKGRTVSSAGKVKASVFWDCQGITSANYLEKWKTITGAYYVRKASTIHPQKVLFDHSYKPAHSSIVRGSKSIDSKLHLRYSPYFSPSVWKNCWREWSIFSNEDEIAKMSAYVMRLEQSYYSEEINKPEQFWT